MVADCVLDLFWMGTSQFAELKNRAEVSRTEGIIDTGFDFDRIDFCS